MKKNKKSRVSVSDAIDAFYKRNKDKLDAIYGSESRARSRLKNDPSMPSYFKNTKNATKKLNSLIERDSDPNSYDLKNRKREAISNTPGAFSSPQQLNRKIDKDGLQYHSKYLGNKDGYEASVDSYYDIKNSNYVLAQIRYRASSSTELFQWEFIDRNLL